MDVFLIGNGFDLHHKFPTSYLNFLNTMQFLTEKYDESFTTVGKVFGNLELQEKDSFIKECYEQHSGVYGLTSIPENKITDMISRLKNNMWYVYLSQSVAADIKWIDFEKEIIRVLDAFVQLLDSDNTFSLMNDRVAFNFSECPQNSEDRFILSKFNFFFEECEETYIGRARVMYIKSKYVVEKISGSHSYHIVVDEIASELYKSLCEFASVLKDYLLYFIDAPAQEYIKLGLKPIFSGLPTPNRVHSFNYTNLFEILYNGNSVDHIHGNTKTNIVLGINPNENDDLGSVDTTFLQFKKYYQRVFYKTDESFLSHMNFIRSHPRTNDSKVFVIGHSLDSTDEDIIKQVFESAKSIVVLYHNETSVKNQIRNLVTIYGKEGLDRLREERNLQFIQQGEVRWQSESSN